MSKLKTIPKFERPREKAMFNGVESLSDVELLAILLRTGIKDKSVLELANDLLHHFGGLYSLFSASTIDLNHIKGISNAKALTLQSCFELFKRIDMAKIEEELYFNNEFQVAKYFCPRFLGEHQENLYLISLNNHHKLLAFHLVYKGTSSSVFGDPRDIFRLAIKDGARKIYLLHNHPSNHIKPSMEDEIATAEMSLFAGSLGIELIDHLIIGKDKAYSLKKKEEINLLSSTQL